MADGISLDALIDRLNAPPTPTERFFILFCAARREAIAAGIFDLAQVENHIADRLVDLQVKTPFWYAVMVEAVARDAPGLAEAVLRLLEQRSQ